MELICWSFIHPGYLMAAVIAASFASLEVLWKSMLWMISVLTITWLWKEIWGGVSAFPRFCASLGLSISSSGQGLILSFDRLPSSDWMNFRVQHPAQTSSSKPPPRRRTTKVCVQNITLKSSTSQENPHKRKLISNVPTLISNEPRPILVLAKKSLILRLTHTRIWN